MSGMTARKDYGPVQLASYLGMYQFQFDRARAAGLIPAPDRNRGRWSAGIADATLARAGEIRAAAGTVPDYGAVRAAAELSERLGIEVTGHGVEELARRGLLPVAGYYKDHAIYDGRAVEAFTDAGAATAAGQAGYLRTADESAAYLTIRRSDLDHLTRSGLLAPAGWGYGPYDRRRNPTVPLYRTGDLDDLAARDDLPWNAVRQARKGQRSPLAALPAVNPCLHDGAGTLTLGGAQ